MGVGVCVSVLVHGGGVWMLLPHAGAREGMATPPPIEIELVNQESLVRGAEAASPAAAPPPVPASPAVAGADGSPAPSPPTPRVPAGPVAAAVNLGGGEQDQEGWVVSGANVRPPRPDARVRNMPPHYPAEAARRHAQGTVSLRAHVMETGVPAWVTVIGSSGDASLDRAAQEAMATWRFLPARKGGVAVAFDYDYDIRFVMDAALGGSAGGQVAGESE